MQVLSLTKVLNMSPDGVSLPVVLVTLQPYGASQDSIQNHFRITGLIDSEKLIGRISQESILPVRVSSTRTVPVHVQL